MQCGSGGGNSSSSSGGGGGGGGGGGRDGSFMRVLRWLIAGSCMDRTEKA